MTGCEADHFRDLDTAWSWVIMVAALFVQFVIGGTNFTVGLVHVVLLERFGGSQAETAWAAALYTSISNFGAPLSSIMVDKFSLRTTIVLSGLFYTIGYVGTAFANNLTLAVFLFGIIGGIGGALGWTAATVGTNFYFRKYRSLAQGISMAGVGVGMFGIPPLAIWSEHNYGSFGFFLSLAAVGIHVIVCGTLMWPSRMELFAKKKRRKELQDEGHSCTSMLQHYVNVLKSRVVQCQSLSTFLLGAGLYSIFVYFPNYVQALGGTDTQGSYLLSVCGVCTIVGRFAAGAIANTDIVLEIVLHTGCLALLAVNALVFPFVAQYYAAQFLFTVVLGLSFGGPFVLLPLTSIRFLGMEKMAAATSIGFCMCGVGAMIGPTIAGRLVDSGATFQHIFLLSGGLFAISAVVCILPVFFDKQHGVSPRFKARLNQDITITAKPTDTLLPNSSTASEKV